MAELVTLHTATTTILTWGPSLAVGKALAAHVCKATSPAATGCLGEPIPSENTTTLLSGSCRNNAEHALNCPWAQSCG